MYNYASVIRDGAKNVQNIKIIAEVNKEKEDGNDGSV